MSLQFEDNSQLQIVFALNWKQGKRQKKLQAKIVAVPCLKTMEERKTCVKTKLID